MEGKVLILLCLVAAAFGAPLSQKPDDLRTALTNYVSWSERASQVFHQDLVTTLDVDTWENSGQETYDALANAIQNKATQLNVELNTDSDEVRRTILAILENGLLPNIQPEVIVGLLAGSDEIETHGAKLVVSTDLFKEVTGRFRILVEELDAEVEIDGERLMEIVEMLYASEIAFDGIVSNFRSVEDKIVVHEDSETESESAGETETETQTDEEATETPSEPETKTTSKPKTKDDDTETDDEVKPLSRRKRQTNMFSLGGGFSSNGQSSMFNRRQNSVSVTPHFSSNRFTGATVSGSRKWNTGSLSGTANLNNRLNFDSGSLTGTQRWNSGSATGTANFGQGGRFSSGSLTGTQRWNGGSATGTANFGQNGNFGGGSLGAEHSWNRGSLSGNANFNNRGRFTGGSLGTSHTFNNGRTSLTGSADLNDRGRVTSGNLGVEHRFNNGRGSVFGGATVQNGQVTGGGLGVKLDFKK